MNSMFIKIFFIIKVEFIITNMGD